MTWKRRKLTCGTVEEGGWESEPGGGEFAASNAKKLNYKVKKVTCEQKKRT